MGTDATGGEARFRAQLFGGEGDGLIIGLEQLSSTITVYQNGGLPFAAEYQDEATAPADARRLGIYELVGPIGPDTPVYIPVR
jgi:hypothetical protein